MSEDEQYALLSRRLLRLEQIVSEQTGGFLYVLSAMNKIRGEVGLDIREDLDELFKIVETLVNKHDLHKISEEDVEVLGND